MNAIYVSSESSDDEKPQNSSVREALDEAKEYLSKNPRTKIMEDTMKRLQSFASRVEQYHEEQSESNDNDNEREKQESTDETESDNEKEKTKRTRKKKQNSFSITKKSSRKSSSRSTTPEKQTVPMPIPNPLDDDPIESIQDEEDLHKDNCVKIVSEIYRYFDKKIPKIAIIIALHKNCGKILEAMKSLEKGEIENDPTVLIDPTTAKGSEEDKRRYFCN